MAKQLRCADVTGDCEAVVTGDTEEEVLNEAVQHAKEVHSLAANEALRDQLRGAIQDA